MSLFYINLDTSSPERYDLGKFLNFENDGFDPLTSSFLLEIENLKVGGLYTIQGEDGRPDWLSYNIYGDVQYWWIIMLYNSYTSIGDIVNGGEIRYPSISTIEDFYFNLNLEQKTDGQ